MRLSPVTRRLLGCCPTGGVQKTTFMEPSHLTWTRVPVTEQQRTRPGTALHIPHALLTCSCSLQRCSFVVARAGLRVPNLEVLLWFYAHTHANGSPDELRFPARQLLPGSTVTGPKGRVKFAAFEQEVVRRVCRHVFYFQGVFPAETTNCCRK